MAGLWAAGFDAAAQDKLAGNANVIDGDTLEIAGIAVRLEGIDAPELRQSCAAEDGRQVACGKRASRALVSAIGGSTVDCEILGQDGYGRLLGDCAVNGENLNARMVRDGWAVAFVKYSDRFAPEESQARSQQAGIWQWRFDKPWDWRAGVLQQAADAPRASSRDCVIKGNISRSGERIYHMPFHQYYGRTKIDESRGERWFCTEDAAQAAGWRRTLR